MLRLNVLPIFKARGIEKPYYYLSQLGLSPYAVNNILYNNVNSISFKHIELLCKVLFCEPSDLFSWTPPKDEYYPDNHPLQGLILKPAPIDVRKTLSTIPYKDLALISNQLKTMQKQEVVNPEQKNDQSEIV